jgi:hypothetical protein
MSRGLFVFVIQMIAWIGVTGSGVWALATPKHFQQFINSNFALLPTTKNSFQMTPLLLRAAGAFALWYGYLLLLGIRRELSSLGLG